MDESSSAGFGGMGPAVMVYRFSISVEWMRGEI